MTNQDRPGGLSYVGQASRPVLIGASVRAAAFSAIRAGLTPWCLDLFADADLCAVAEARAISFTEYPQQFAELLDEAPPGPVIYTGGLENYPQLIDEIAAKRPLWGNGAEALRLSRDPIHISRILTDSGLPSPPLREKDDEAGRWLRKPLRSAGGANIAFAEDSDSHHGGLTPRPSPTHYFQQFIPGPSYAANYCAFPDRTELLGVTEQLTGESWLNAQPFHYCGSIGPVDLPSTIQNELMRLGDVLRIGCGLRGLFGVDFILHDNQPWPVEVNPRYTASIEVLELATGLRAMTEHLLAFETIALSPTRKQGAADSILARASGSEDGAIVGKAILFATKKFTFPVQVGDYCADIPQPGSIIEAGWPILTIFAQGATSEECRDELKRRAAEMLKKMSIQAEG